MRVRPPTFSGVAIGAAVVLIVTATTATAAALITSADIKDNTVQSKDLKNNNIASADIKDATITSADIKNNVVVSGDIKDGTIAAADLSSATVDSLKTTYSGPKWGIVDRNVIGNGDSYLRSGPFEALGQDPPPDGIGSLGIRTGSPADAAAFGNEIDFQGDPVQGLVSVGFSVFTTGENNGVAANNMPAIKIEIIPNLDGGGPGFSTMVYQPDNSLPGVWTSIDAVADPGLHWGLTGGLANGECGINGARCTFEDLIDFLDDGAPDALILTVQVGKGRDFAFSGAVDSLVINNEKFDFEPFGVITTTP